MRERRRQPLIEIVQSENIAVEHLALPCGRQRVRPALRNAAVHIPFHVGDLAARENRRHLLIDIIDDILPGEIEHTLRASE